MSQASRCPACGAPLPADTPGGDCPRCLLALGLRSLLSAPPEEPQSAPARDPAAAFPQLDRYRVLEQLGEGGCGVVYRAEQLEPVRREVAVKVIKLGMDTHNVIARFDAERQALALMDHPGIARVFDAGATRHGRPFFTMELVPGPRLTDFCAEQRLNLTQRLELFAEVCHAVQHAHQKGIIHRDLKPSNILVATVDGRPQPKIIDFGVAKATARQRLADQTVYTAFDQFVGTPAYMSPEQAGLTGDDIDTRSDIYSLGVLLYELLTGCPPFDPERLRTAALDEVCRIIREEEPEKPSTRLTKALVAADVSPLKSAGSDQREFRADSRRLLQEVRGDLDWIVMKALEKDRARRYETANGLAADIRRVLAHEPVVARPPSASYRFQKWARRNQLAVTAGAIVFVALLAAVFISTTRYRREREARQQAVAAEARATLQAQRSDQVARLLKETLTGAGPSVALGRDTTLLREILDRTAERISQEAYAPEIEAEMRHTIGRTYADLREMDKAIAMYRAEIAVRQKIQSGTNQFLRNALLELAVALNSRAGATDLLEAEALFRQVLPLYRATYGEQSLEVAKVAQMFASHLSSQRKLPEAESLYREVLQIRQAVQGEEHPALITCYESLAWMLSHDSQRLAEAEDYLQRAHVIRERMPASETPARIESLALRATILRAAGKPADAEAAARAAIALRRKLYGPESEALPTLLSTLSIALSDQGKAAEAEQVIREAIELQRRHHGPEHPHLANFLLGTLMKALLDQHKWAEAEAVGMELIPLLQKVSPHRRLARLDGLHLLAVAQIQQQHWAAAEQSLREAVEVCEQPLETGRLSSPARCARLKRMLGEALLRQSKHDATETFLLTAYETLRPSTNRLDQAELEHCMANLIELYESTQRPAEADRWRRELEQFKLSQPETGPARP